MFRYFFDQDYGVPAHTFAAHERAGDWNGFVVPLVDEATLLATLARFNALAEEDDGDYCAKAEVAADGEITLFEYARPVGDNDQPVAATKVPRHPAGYYELSFGWTLVADDHYES